MVKVAALGGLALGKGGIARKLIAKCYEAIVAEEAPGIVFESAEVETVKRVRAVLAGKRGIVELARTVVGAEEKAEGVLRIARAAAETTTNAKSRVDVKPVCAAGINQLDRGGALPIDAVLPCVRVNAGGG